jgi:hypothetical protein
MGKGALSTDARKDGSSGERRLYVLANVKADARKSGVFRSVLFTRCTPTPLQALRRGSIVLTFLFLNALKQ